MVKKNNAKNESQKGVSPRKMGKVDFLVPEDREIVTFFGFQPWLNNRTTTPPEN